MNEKKSCAISRRSFLKGAGAVGAASVLAACGGNSTAASGSGAEAAAEGKVINIYSWNDEFRTRLEAVYSEVASTSSDGTVTTLKDGTEIHWIINPNQDGVYQQKLDEALLNQASGSTDDKVDIFLSETDYVYKYTDAEADVAMPPDRPGHRPRHRPGRPVPLHQDHRFGPERGPARLHLAVLPGPSGLPAGYCEGRLWYR